MKCMPCVVFLVQEVTLVNSMVVLISKSVFCFLKEMSIPFLTPLQRTTFMHVLRRSVTCFKVAGFLAHVYRNVPTVLANLFNTRIP